MQSSTRSNTESLEFDPEETPPGLVEVQNRAVIRNNRRAPAVYASDFLDGHGASRQSQSEYSITHNSEKIDWINVMECLARSMPSEDPTTVESVYAVPHVAHQDDRTVAKVEPGEEKLCVHLAEKYASLKTTASAFISAVSQDGTQREAWPSLPPPVTGKRVRARAPHKEDEDEDEVNEGELTGLDAQLADASRVRGTSRVSAATNVTAEQQASLFCDAVKSFSVSNTSRQLAWQQNYVVEEDIPSVQEQFRAPAAAVRQLVNDRMFLLDDHSLEVNLRKRGGAGGSRASASRVITETSKEKLIKQATDRLDVAGNMRCITAQQVAPEHIASVKEQALHRALARHTEAVADAAVEMVTLTSFSANATHPFFTHVFFGYFQQIFQHFVPTANGPLSSNSQKRESEKLTGPSKKKLKTANKAPILLMESEPQVETQNAPNTDLFTWEDIMRCLHAKVEANSSAQKRDARVVVHQDLPSLHLSGSVVERTERRLRALYRGETDAHSLRAVPTVFDYSADTARTVLQAHAGAGDSGSGYGGKAASTVVKTEQEKSTRTRSRQIITAEAPTTGAAELSGVRIKEKVAGKLIQPHVPITVWDN